MNEYDNMCAADDFPQSGIMTVLEVQYTYFAMYAETRTHPLRNDWSIIDEILTGWENMSDTTGCTVWEFIISDTEHVAALTSQEHHIIACIYVRGHA